MQENQEHKEPPELAERVMLWTAICGGSAAPSFIWAWNAVPPNLAFDVAAMLTGVAIITVIYIWATGTQFVVRLQTRPRAAKALRTGYLLRLFLSALFPLGMGVDLIPGVISASIVEGLSGGVIGRAERLGVPVSFPATLAITLLQGLFLNLIGFAFMGIVYGLLPRRLDNPNLGLCEKCGYDLRASYQFGRCPECGTPYIAPPGWNGTESTAANTSQQA
jgi:hypothetical protein